MDPISDILGVVGLGMSLFGSSKQSDIAEKESAVSRNIAAEEQQQNDLRRQSMEMSSRRSQMENLRNAQRARAQGIAAGTNQGAQFGSGMAGALAQNKAQETWNSQGLGQSLALGRQNFDITAQISQNKMQMASLQGDMASAQAWSSLGGSVMKAAPMLGSFGQSAMSFGSNMNSLFSNDNMIFGNG